MLFSTKYKYSMKKRAVDIVIILSIALLLTLLYHFNLSDKSTKYMFIPLLTYYYIGQYTERKFKK